MKNRKFLLQLLALVVLTLVSAYALLLFISSRNHVLPTENIAIKSVRSEISASGTIHSKNEATLHFQIGGKLVYLPFKQGDTVSQGQTIALLDAQVIEKNIQSAVDAYNNQKISFDITNDFNGDRALSDTGLSISARRQLETAINTLDQTSLAVDIQQLAKEQAVLTSPITGILVSEDVTLPYVNITPTTSFSVADPTSLVFRANILPQDFDFVSIGAPVTIKIDGLQNKAFVGLVTKIYPQKTTVNNQAVYQVDVESTEISKIGKLYQSGSVLIQGNLNKPMLLVPTWTIINHEFIWVLSHGTPILKKVVIGKTHGKYTEIIDGLTSQDSIVLDPKSIAKIKYQLL